ncbi:hypothetical protein Bca4012_098585 [Brassica carinata]
MVLFQLGFPGEEASEPCLAGKRRKETKRSSSALPPKPTKLIAHGVHVWQFFIQKEDDSTKKAIVVSVNFQKLKVELKTHIVRVLQAKELNVFSFHFVFDSA